MSKRTIYPYVDDEILIKEVESIFASFQCEFTALDHSFFDNVIDPFSAFFESACNSISYDEWVKLEKNRQLQKSLQNMVGYFHQRILGSIDGWNDPKAGGGFDSENIEQKIFAEIKNKYNTMNSKSAQETYNRMVHFLNTSKKGHTGYVVYIIPKTPKRFKKNFAPSNNPKRSDLFVVDGATYYSMCTGDPKALALLYNSLHKVVKKLTDKNFNSKINMNAFLELFNKAYGI